MSRVGRGDCHAIVKWLKQIVAKMRPERVICLGNGMGGYAAIMFAMLLNADRATVLNPLLSIQETGNENPADRNVL
ncbi:hypothetical protein [Azotobacter armeniacus]